MVILEVVVFCVDLWKCSVASSKEIVANGSQMMVPLRQGLFRYYHCCLVSDFVGVDNLAFDSIDVYNR